MKITLILISITPLIIISINALITILYLIKRKQNGYKIIKKYEK